MTDDTTPAANPSTSPAEDHPLRTLLLTGGGKTKCADPIVLVDEDTGQPITAVDEKTGRTILPDVLQCHGEFRWHVVSDRAPLKYGVATQQAGVAAGTWFHISTEGVGNNDIQLTENEARLLHHQLGALLSWAGQQRAEIFNLASRYPSWPQQVRESGLSLREHQLADLVGDELATELIAADNNIPVETE